MKSIFTMAAFVGVLVVAAADVHAMGGNHGGSGGSDGQGFRRFFSDSKGPTTSVPEPSTLYALGSGVALLGGAGWYIRRRK
jgi:hypothetical protein